MDSNKVIIVGLLLVTVIISAVSGVKVFYYGNDNTRPAVVNHQPQTINIGRLVLPTLKKSSDDWWATDDLHSAGSTLGVHLDNPSVQEKDKQSELPDNFSWKDFDSSGSALNFKVEPFVQSAIGSSTHGKFVGQSDPKDTKIDYKPVPSASADDIKSVSEELSDYGSDEEYYDDEPGSSETDANKGPTIEAITTLKPIQETITTNQKTESDLNESESVVASKQNKIEKVVPKAEPTESNVKSTSTLNPVQEEVTTRKPNQEEQIIKSFSDVITESSKESKTETAEGIAFIPVKKLDQDVIEGPASVVFLKDRKVEEETSSEHKAKASNKDSNTEKGEQISESTSTDSKTVSKADDLTSFPDFSLSQNQESSSHPLLASTLEVEYEHIPIEIPFEHQETTSLREQYKEDSNTNNDEREVSEQPTETNPHESFAQYNFYRLFPKPESPSFQDKEQRPAFDYPPEDYREGIIETSTSPESYTVDRPELSASDNQKSPYNVPIEETEHPTHEFNSETEATFPLASHTQLREPIPYSHSRSKFVDGVESTHLHLPTSDSLSSANEQLTSSSEIPLNPFTTQDAFNDEDLPSDEPIEYQHPSTAIPLTNERGEKLMGLFFRTKPPVVPIPQTFDQPLFYPNPSLKKKPIEPSHEFAQLKKPAPQKEQRPFDSNPGVIEHRPPTTPFQSHSLPNYHRSPSFEENRQSHPSNQQPSFVHNLPHQNSQQFPSTLTKIVEPLHSFVRFQNAASSPSLQPLNHPVKPEFAQAVGREPFAPQRPIATREPLQHFPKAEHQKTPFQRPAVRHPEELHSARPFITHPQDDRVNTGLTQQGHHQVSRPTASHPQPENVRHENPFEEENPAHDQQQESSVSSALSNGSLVSRDPHQPPSQQLNPSPVDNSRQPPAANQPIPRTQTPGKLVYPVPMAFRTQF